MYLSSTQQLQCLQQHVMRECGQCLYLYTGMWYKQQTTIFSFYPLLASIFNVFPHPLTIYSVLSHWLYGWLCKGVLDLSVQFCYYGDLDYCKLFFSKRDSVYCIFTSECIRCRWSIVTCILHIILCEIWKKGIYICLILS